MQTLEAKTMGEIEMLENEYPKMIEGAKQAVAYFESMLNAHKAIGEVVQSQLDYALDQVTKLENEYEKKFKS